VKPDFVWHAFKQGAPVVLVSGCHYVDCHYIDANRSTVRRVDALWDGLQKRDIRPERLQLDWCSAAEGRKWAKIMEGMETLRAGVTADEVEQTKEALAGAKAPKTSKVGRLREATSLTMRCLRCGNEWETVFDPNADEERMCSACRSNSVRVLAG
jgi:hypothetical protein